MKKLSLINKLLVVVNTLLAIILLISYLSYFVAPNGLSIISFISLSIPALILLNLGFVLYWLLNFKRQFLISLIVLIIGVQYITKLYRFSEKKVLLTSDIKIMSYNVRMFNLYNWIDDEETAQHIYEFINTKDPDILCIQEFQPSPDLGFKYPYKYVKISEKNNQFGHAIFSKFKILHTGSLNFTNSSNNAIFADILKGRDTIRVYNVHLESLKMNPAKEPMDQDLSEKFRKRVEKAFNKQADQALKIVNHQEGLSHRSIICGDFNNTAFSWPYHTLLKNKNDAFEIAGKGFGKTFDIGFPLRIDFILADKEIEVNNFKTFKVRYSDHYPIMARLNF